MPGYHPAGNCWINNVRVQIEISKQAMNPPYHDIIPVQYAIVIRKQLYLHKIMEAGCKIAKRQLED